MQSFLFPMSLELEARAWDIAAWKCRGVDANLGRLEIALVIASPLRKSFKILRTFYDISRTPVITRSSSLKIFWRVLGCKASRLL